jgi:hypothetical protein
MPVVNANCARAKGDVKRTASQDHILNEEQCLIVVGKVCMRKYSCR